MAKKDLAEVLRLCGCPDVAPAEGIQAEKASRAELAVYVLTNRPSPSSRVSDWIVIPADSEKVFGVVLGHDNGSFDRFRRYKLEDAKKETCDFIQAGQYKDPLPREADD